MMAGGLSSGFAARNPYLALLGGAGGYVVGKNTADNLDYYFGLGEGKPQGLMAVLKKTLYDVKKGVEQEALVLGLGGAFPLLINGVKRNKIGDELKRKAKSVIDPFGKPFHKYTGNPDGAINQLLKTKQGYVPSAIYKEGVGNIDLIWGIAGREGTKEGSGLAHIIRRRNEQGLNGYAFARKIPEIAIKGRVVPDKSHSTRINIIYGQDKLVIETVIHGNKRIWLLTGFHIGVK